MLEEWRLIKDFPYYEVSNTGVVRSWKASRNRTIEEPKYLFGSFGNRNYECVTLRNGKKRKTLLIHRLVLEAFIGPCPLGHEANHKDGITSNNFAENLEWITRSENIKHAFKLGFKDHKGVNHPRASLTDKDVIKIRYLYNSGICANQRALGLLYKTSQENISNIICRKAWNHI